MKIKVLRFWPFGFKNAPMIIPFTEEAFRSLWQFIAECSVDEGYSISLAEMPKEDFDKLPEHLGW